MKTLVRLCFMALLGLVLVEGGRGPCGCRRVLDFCANDYNTYHSICEYKCKHPSKPFQEWYILYHGPCLGLQTEAKMETTITSITTELPTTRTPFKSYYNAIPGYVWEPSTGSRYKVHTAAETWSSAKATCEAEGGYLAIINSWTESNHLKDMFNEYSLSMITGTEDKFKYYASLGFSKLKNAQWQTLQGQSLADAGFNEWSDGKPSNGDGIQNCGAMYWNGKLSDASCDTERYPFICEA